MLFLRRFAYISVLSTVVLFYVESVFRKSTFFITHPHYYGEDLEFRSPVISSSLPLLLV